MGEQEKKKEATATATTYAGTYSLTNCTGENITNIFVEAYTGAGKFSRTADSLGPGQTLGPVDFKPKQVRTMTGP